MTSLTTLLAVAAGGGAGAAARYAVSGFVAERMPAGFPYGTLVVNVTGSFLLGLLATLALDRYLIPRFWFVLLGAGFCGGYTTFSTFSYETLRLAAEGSWGRAAANVLASVAATLAGGALGILAGRAL